MKATKETAREAARRLVAEGTKPNTTMTDVDYRFLIGFLDAAEKRLPTEKAVAADRARRRSKNKVRS